MKKIVRDVKLKMLAWSSIICFLLTFFRPEKGEGVKMHVLYYGFPLPFLTLYTQEFFMQFESHASGMPIHLFQRFSVNLFPLGVNIAIIWLVLLFFYKLFKKFMQVNKK